MTYRQPTGEARWANTDTSLHASHNVSEECTYQDHASCQDERCACPHHYVDAKYDSDCGAQVQVLANPAPTLDALLDSLDWNVCLFGFDGQQTIQREQLANIQRGKDLQLQKVTFPLSTLRRGFRFSERFKMRLKYVDVITLTTKILENQKKNNAKGPTGNEPDASALAANTLVDDDIDW